MTTPMTQSEIVKKRFERDAAAFDAIYHGQKSEFSGWFNRTFRKPIFERHELTFKMLGDLHGKTVLDVGCGSGVYSTQCAMNGAKLVRGIDYSEPMLNLARNRANAHSVAANCEFQLVDFMTMNVSEPFDFSFAMGVFDYLPDPAPFLKKMKEVTKTRIVASFPGHSLIRAPLRKMRYMLTSKGNVYFYTRKDIENLVKDLNFRHVEIRPLATGSGFFLIADI